MAKILDMPKLSPTMEEGVLQSWHKNEGDTVEVDDLLAEVETDKATMEFRSFDRGTLLKILVAAGTNVKLGDAVAILGDAGEDVAVVVATAGAAAGADAEVAERVATSRDAATLAPPAQKQGPATVAEGSTAPGKPRAAAKSSLLDRTSRDVELEANSGNAGSGRIIASPYVRKVARERGIDLADAHGSGEHGRIVPADLESITKPNAESVVDGATPSALARISGAKAPPFPALALPESRPLSPMRKAIARRLSESKRTVPHFYLTIDVDVEELSRLRESINAQLAKGMNKSPPGDVAAKPDKVSLNDLVIKAAAAALVSVPECNAQFSDEALLVQKRVDISVAVAIPDGLVTPVVRNADQKSVVAIAREVRDLAARARAKKLKPEQMRDGTFSISNLGMFGIDAFSAVINPPEGAILAVGQARAEPVVRDGAVVPGVKMSLTLSCDHRVIDGAVGAAFLAELRALLEHPLRILTG